MSKIVPFLVALAACGSSEPVDSSTGITLATTGEASSSTSVNFCGGFPTFYTPPGILRVGDDLTVGAEVDAIACYSGAALVATSVPSGTTGAGDGAVFAETSSNGDGVCVPYNDAGNVLWNYVCEQPGATTFAFFGCKGEPGALTAVQEPQTELTLDCI